MLTTSRLLSIRILIKSQPRNQHSCFPSSSSSSFKKAAATFVTMAPTPILLAPDRAMAAGIILEPNESAFRENSATIVMPSAEAAFLNPVQEFNRDLSILAIKTWSERMDAEKKARFLHSKAKKQGKLKRKTVASVNGTKEHGLETIASVNGANEQGLATTTSVNGTKRQRLDSDGNSLSKHDEKTSTDSNEPPPPQEEEEKELNTLSEQYKPYQFTCLEALSATGLRSIRYAKEIPLLKWVLANDLSPSAVEAMKRNVALNFPPGRPIGERISSEVDKSVTHTVDTANEAPGPVGQDTPQELENHDNQPSPVSTEPSSLAASLSTNTTTTTSAAAAAATTTTSTPHFKNAIHPDCKVKLNAGDAITLMYQHREPLKHFDVVDLDPYGSAAPFIDGGVQSVADGGLLCVTCTDLAVLAGHNYPEKCFSQYGGVSVKAEYSHEVALRLVLHSIASSAARYGRYIQPLLTLSIDFYMRTFVRVWTGPAEVKNNASKTGTVYVCSHCQNFHIQRLGRSTRTESVGKNGQTNLNYRYQVAQGPPFDTNGSECQECGGKLHLGGPMWFGPLHDSTFCQSMIDQLDLQKQSLFSTESRIRGMVSLALQELPNDAFYFTPPKVSGLFHCISPPLDRMVSALLSAGFQVSRSHASPGSLKTNATRSQVYDIFRNWCQKHYPVKIENVKQSDPAHRLLSTTAKVEIDYDFDHDKVSVQKILGTKVLDKKNSVRYQNNPLPNWGPGTAAKGHKGKKKRNTRPDDVVGM